VWLQELNLSPQQRLALRDFLEWNERPENRYYRYDYYRDNCSTRVRDALDRILQGQLRSETDTIRTNHSYRFHTKRLTSSDPLLYTGLLVGLAQPADHRLTAWEEMFLPLELRAWVRQVHVSDGAGGEMPLVRSERVLFQSSQPGPPSGPPHWLPGYLVLGLALGGALWWLGLRTTGSDWRGKGFLFLAVAWTLTTGIAGSLLAFLWAFTDHAVAYRNENLFQANLLALPLVVLIPGWKNGEAWAARPAVRLAVLVAAVSLLGVIVKVLPMFYQDNMELLALAVPAHLGLAAGLLGSARPTKD
jgi:hypothetical protein